MPKFKNIDIKNLDNVDFFKILIEIITKNTFMRHLEASGSESSIIASVEKMNDVILHN